MSGFKSFRCAKCEKSYLEDKVPPNDGCGGRIDITLDIDSLRESITRDSLEKRRGGLWKYFEFMPLRQRESIVSLGEGNTSLLDATRLAEHFGMRSLQLKNETTNPSGSFKDRPICVGLSRAVEDGAKTVASASSGNAAAALSTYAAKAGVRAVVFVPEDAPKAKLVHLRTLGAQVLRIRETEAGVDPTTTLLRKVQNQLGWTPIPSFGPFNCFQFEGTKSLAYEVAEQMKWEPPDWILFPTGSGGLMAGTMKGFAEFLELGLIERLPKPVVVQPEGCAPIVRAHKNKNMGKTIESWDSAKTIAGGLADPYPWDWDASLKYLRMAKGEAVAVSDAKIDAHLRLLAKTEGIFAEPSGVAALAGLEELIERGVIDRTDSVVVPITGTGFKDLGHIEQLMGETPVIAPEVEKLKDALDRWYT